MLSPTESSIVFLGTGQGSFVVGKQIRSSAGFVLQVMGNQFIVDPGPGFLPKCRENNINIRETTGILISHAHVNHCSDINAVIDAMTYSGLDRQGVLIANETLVNGTESISPYLTKHHRNLLERVMVVRKDQRIATNDIEIEALQANHTDPGSIGFKFITPDFNLSYSGDTGYSGRLADYYKESDILILNVPFPGNKPNDGNLCTQDALKIIEKAKPSLSIITHFSSKMIDADPINEAREIQKATGQQVIAAKDSFKINPKAYSAKKSQKSLKQF